MPGLSVNDFGDSIRFGASTGAEDEPDLTKISCDLSLFEAYTKLYRRMRGSPDRRRAESACEWRKDDDAGMRHPLPDGLSGGGSLFQDSQRRTESGPLSYPVQAGSRHGTERDGNAGNRK